jgi:hypothetical protein
VTAETEKAVELFVRREDAERFTPARRPSGINPSEESGDSVLTSAKDCFPVEEEQRASASIAQEVAGSSPASFMNSPRRAR